jgi:hypothetical protein
MFAGDDDIGAARLQQKEKHQRHGVLPFQAASLGSGAMVARRHGRLLGSLAASRRAA